MGFDQWLLEGFQGPPWCPEDRGRTAFVSSKKFLKLGGTHSLWLHEGTSVGFDLRTNTGETRRSTEGVPRAPQRTGCSTADLRTDRRENRETTPEVSKDPVVPREILGCPVVPRGKRIRGLTRLTFARTLEGPDRPPEKFRGTLRCPEDRDRTVLVSSKRLLK